MKRALDISTVVIAIALIYFTRRYHVSTRVLFGGIMLIFAGLVLWKLIIDNSVKSNPNRPSGYTRQFRIGQLFFYLGLAVLIYLYPNGVTVPLCILLVFINILTLDSNWFLTILLRRNIRIGNLERAGKIAQELYFKIVARSFEGKRKNKRRKQDAKAFQLLGQYRESIGDYYVASMFYEWAISDIVQVYSRESKSEIQVRPKPLISILCDHIRILHFFDRKAAEHKIQWLQELVSQSDDPNLLVKSMTVGVSNSLLANPFKSIYGDSIQKTVLWNEAAKVIERLRRNISIDDYLFACQLADLCYKDNDTGLAVKILHAIISNTSYENDIRFLFICIDAQILKAFILLETDNVKEEFFYIDDILEKIRLQFIERAAFGNEYALFALSARVSDMIRVYLTLVCTKTIKGETETHLFETYQSYKGISLELRLKVREAFMNRTDKKDLAYLEEMNSLRTQMSGLWASKHEFNRHTFIMASIQLQDTENYMIRKSGLDFSFLKKLNISIKDIQSVLLPEERFCQIIKSGDHRNAFYIGLVLEKDSPLRVITLGAAGELEEAIENWREIIAIGGNPPYNSKYMRVLQLKLIEPLLPSITRIDRLIINAEDSIGLLSFDAFYIADGQSRLVENFEIMYVDGAKDLLKRRDLSQQGPSGQSVVFSNPDFDFTGIETYDNDSISGNKFGGRAFRPLDHTRDEGQIISKLLNATLYQDREATAVNLKKVDNPRILHVATHAFSEFTSFKTGKLSNLSAYIDPMGRCGLAMAGINAVNAQEAIDDKIVEDGMISALEVFSLNIRYTQLVVLSACETGLGRIHSGEGMLGLRSAFKTGGARTVVNSLWNADDHITRLLMEEFYINILKGDTVSQSLRMAKLKIYNTVNPSPYFWALFVCYGLSIEKVKN